MTRIGDVDAAALDLQEGFPEISARMFLAVDALGAGLGMAMAGYDIFYTAIMVAVLKLILVSGGMTLGKYAAQKIWQTWLAWLPGIILLVIAAREFF